MEEAQQNITYKKHSIMVFLQEVVFLRDHFFKKKFIL